jgi:hypothetical protein
MGGVFVRVTRIFTGTDGESHFEDLDIPLRDFGAVGAMSEPIGVTGLVLRETGPDYDLDWHHAPRRQFVVMLSGGLVEIEVGDGSRRRLGPGDILLAEDTTGRGHISRAVDDQPRVSLFITLD